MKKIEISELKIIISVAMIGISIILFFNSIYNKNSEKIYTYNISQNTKYRVYVEKNAFFNNDYLEMEGAYIQQSVRNIEINFNYNFVSASKKDIGYIYDIVATLYIDYANTGQNLYTKEYEIIKDKFLNKKDENRMNVNEIINIDYINYLNEVQTFREKYNLPVKAYLKVSFYINTNIALEEQVTDVSTAEVNIDLSSPVFEIKVSQSDDQNETILETGEILKKSNRYLMTFSIILFTVFTIYLIFEVNKQLMTKEVKNKIELNKILKRYSKIIIEVNEKVEIQNKNVIMVKDFYELLEIEEEIREPILYYSQEREAVFSIIDNDIIYRCAYRI